MILNELININNDSIKKDLENADLIELYETIGSRYELHTDFVNFLETYDSLEEIEKEYLNRDVLDFELMDKSRYLDTIEANTCITEDILDDILVYVIVLK